MKNDKTEYFKVRKDRWEIWGERYFRLSWATDKVVQVCITTGDVKKGKSNTFGIYLICKLTLFSNYMAQGYVEKCDKKEFDKKFDQVVKYLK